MKFLYCLFFVQSLFCQVQKDKNSYNYKIISVLASDTLQGRSSSSIFEDKAALFLTKEFVKLKLKPQFHEFNYKKSDTATIKKSKNIYCFYNQNSDSTIVLGAHYDHLGLGEGISRSFGKKGIHYGADDNASGVALLLNLAKDKKKWMSKKYNYLFVCYSAHEVGLFGSASFTEFTANQFKKIVQVYNFDMVGRLDNDSKIMTVYGLKTLTVNKKNLFKNVPFSGQIAANYDDTILNTDAGAFAQKGIASLSFTTGIHSDYHKISDTIDKINFKGMKIIQQYVLSVLKSLE